MSYIGNMIKVHRLIKGMSQEELGSRLGVGRAAVNKYEKGLVENIPIKTIEKMAEIFETTPVDLLGWDYEAKLSYEVKILQGVQYCYGSDTVELIHRFTKLSGVGRSKLLSYLEDLAFLEHLASLYSTESNTNRT